MSRLYYTKVSVVGITISYPNTDEAILGSERYEFSDIAVNGTEAVRRYKEEKPDLVTMDLLMGGMDGVQAIKEIKKYDPKVLILVISALDTADYRNTAKEAGADEYLALGQPFKFTIDDPKGSLGERPL